MVEGLFIFQTEASLRRSGREGGQLDPLALGGNTPLETGCSMTKLTGDTATESTGGSGLKYATESNQQVCMEPVYRTIHCLLLILLISSVLLLMGVTSGRGIL